MELLLIRHAEPVRIDAGEVAGPADPALTDRGREQAASLARWFVGDRIDHVATSPLRRARETAEPLARVHALEPEVLDGLVEYDAAVNDYIPTEELRRLGDERWTAMVEGRWEDYGGERPEVFAARVVPAIDEVIARFPGRRVAMVCHGGVINVYLAALLGIDRRLWFEPAYTSVSRVTASRHGVRSLATLNETGHLLGERNEADAR